VLVFLVVFGIFDNSEKRVVASLEVSDGLFDLSSDDNRGIGVAKSGRAGGGVVVVVGSVGRSRHLDCRVKR
jgi:hypothetical protein